MNLRTAIIEETARLMLTNGGNAVNALHDACATIEGANGFLNRCTAREEAGMLCAIGDRFHAARIQTIPEIAEALPGRRVFRLVCIFAEETAPPYTPFFHAAHDTDAAARTAARILIAAEAKRTGRTPKRAELYDTATTPYKAIPCADALTGSYS